MGDMTELRSRTSGNHTSSKLE